MNTSKHCPEHVNTEFFVTSVCHAKFLIFISVLVIIQFDWQVTAMVSEKIPAYIFQGKLVKEGLD
jgi:hypothetical protein